MPTEYRPEMLGSPTKRPRKVDAAAAIEKMENELKEMAATLRAIRQNYVQGEISEKELQEAEARFLKILSEQRKKLESMHHAMKK